MNLWIDNFNHISLIVSIILLFIILFFSNLFINYTNINYKVLGIALLLLLLFWNLKIQVNNGDQNIFIYNIFGTTLITLMLGIPVAIFVVTLANLIFIITNFNMHTIYIIGVNVLLIDMPSIIITYLVFRLTIKYLSKNIFIFIFINAFFTAALNMLITQTIINILLDYLNIYDKKIIWSNYFSVYILLMWIEAFITGFFVSIFIALLPEFLHYYNDSIYIKNKYTLYK